MNKFFGLLKVKRRYPLVIIVLFLMAIITIRYFGVLINITPSMELGFYRKSMSHIKRGDIIAFCLPDPYKTLGLSKHYIQEGKKCEGADPLIKLVIAVPGDHVTLAKNYIEVNANKYFYATFSDDSEGRSLEIYPRGDYQNTQGYWLVGTHAKNSWDSRYWGPIGKDRILYKLKPLLIW
jgi:conjugative transfer signal peptidase TraF